MAEPNAPEPREQVIRDRLAEQIEERFPEGPSPKKSDTKTLNRVLFAFGALGLTGLVVLLFVRGGPAAGSVGLIILFFYAFFGSTPWMAGSLRARDHKEVEARVDEVVGVQDPQNPPRAA